MGVGGRGLPTPGRARRERPGRDCRWAVEERHDLRRTAPRDRTSVPPTTKAARERAAKRSKPEASRDVLRREVRTAAATSRSESEFFDRLRARGVMVTTRLSTQDGAVTPTPRGPRVTSPAPSPVVAPVRSTRPQPTSTEPRVSPTGRSRAPPAAGAGLRASSVLLAASSAIPDKDTRQLVASLALLAEAVAALRARQGRPHQAQAAQRAAQHLHQHHAQQLALVRVAAGPERSRYNAREVAVPDLDDDKVAPLRVNDDAVDAERGQEHLPDAGRSALALPAQPFAGRTAIPSRARLSSEPDEQHLAGDASAGASSASDRRAAAVMPTGAGSGAAAARCRPLSAVTSALRGEGAGLSRTPRAPEGLALLLAAPRASWPTGSS